MKHLTLLLPLAAAAWLGATALPAQVPQLLNYQGRIISNGTNFGGNGLFKFALVNAAGNISYWSNDGTSAAGSQPAAAVTLPVVSGLYSVLLGDTSLAGMPTAISTTVFNNSDVRLRVWFNDGVTGFQLLTPDQRIAAVGYAMMGANVPDGAITTAKIADGAITGVKIADGTIVTGDLAPNSVNSTHIIDGQVQNADLANNAVNSAKIQDLTIATTDLANNAVTTGKVLDGTLLGADLAEGTVGTRELANSIALGRSNAVGRLDVFYANTASNQPAISLFGSASQISTYGSDGQEQIRLWGSSWGEMYLYDSSAANNLAVNLTANGAGGGLLNLYEGGTNRLGAQMTAGTTGGGTLRLYRGGTSSSGVQLLGGSTLGGLASIYNGTNTETIRLDGAVGSTIGSRISLNQANGTLAVRLSAEEYAGDGGLVSVRNAAGVEKIELDGDDGDGGAAIRLRNADGTVTITLDAALGGDGRITTQELQITGGSDLSEQFDITAPELDIQPGMVVCIDPKNPGQLILSTRAHDRTVAGIISGAGGVKPGMLMGQKGTAADGKHPVALTGRVYCWMDASHGAIEPGDLLTTSDTPGHGMKVTQHTQAQGAILGKAMTGLHEGKGLVLVLVTLQ
jgi:hypothetical protein